MKKKSFFLSRMRKENRNDTQIDTSRSPYVHWLGYIWSFLWSNGIWPYAHLYCDAWLRVTFLVSYIKNRFLPSWSSEKKNFSSFTSFVARLVGKNALLGLSWDCFSYVTELWLVSIKINCELFSLDMLRDASYRIAHQNTNEAFFVIRKVSWVAKLRVEKPSGGLDLRPVLEVSRELVLIERKLNDNLSRTVDISESKSLCDLYVWAVPGV